MGTGQRWLVREVHNFGGFFGGDTVTLTATPWPDSEDETTLVIDEKALTNIRDRHTVAPGMLFDLTMAGERVDRAEVLGAQEWEVLHEAFGKQPPAAPLNGPTVRAFHCHRCGLWIPGVVQATCPICEAVIEP